jgi:hypothetical protein
MATESQWVRTDFISGGVREAAEKVLRRGTSQGTHTSGHEKIGQAILPD